MMKSFFRQKRKLALLTVAVVLAGLAAAASIAYFTRPEPIVVPAGTALEVRLTTGVNSKANEPGDSFEGVLEHAVVVANQVVIPAGARVEGKVAHAVASGRLKQRAELWLTLTEVEVNGESYDLATSTAGRKEGSKTKRDVGLIGGGAGIGALIGGLAGGGKGAAIGAGVGAGGGTAAAALTGQRDIYFPPETRLRFRLEEDLEVSPSDKE